jgi:hypothetical protein
MQETKGRQGRVSYPKAKPQQTRFLPRRIIVARCRPLTTRKLLHPIRHADLYFIFFFFVLFILIQGPAGAMSMPW